MWIKAKERCGLVEFPLKVCLLQNNFPPQRGGRHYKYDAALQIVVELARSFARFKVGVWNAFPTPARNKVCSLIDRQGVFPLDLDVRHSHQRARVRDRAPGRRSRRHMQQVFARHTSIRAKQNSGW